MLFLTYAKALQLTLQTLPLFLGGFPCTCYGKNVAMERPILAVDNDKTVNLNVTCDLP